MPVIRDAGLDRAAPICQSTGHSVAAATAAARAVRNDDDVGPFPLDTQATNRQHDSVSVIGVAGGVTGIDHVTGGSGC